MKVLLVEANYKNKYPPMGLMKISQYHKNRGDDVYFYKGCYQTSELWDRIYITTLFTFDYDLVKKTILYYLGKVKSSQDIYIGGIAATIMSDRFKSDLDMENIISGLLTDSSMIGFHDGVNIDELPLDYDMLIDTNYKYKEQDNYFAYITRGCINTCPFCSVPMLEGSLSYSNTFEQQLLDVKSKFGDKRKLVLLDNNILGLELDVLKGIVNKLMVLGYVKEKTYVKENPLEVMIKDYERLLISSRSAHKTVLKIQDYLKSLSTKRLSQVNRECLDRILESLESEEDYMSCIYKNMDVLKEISYKYYDKKKYTRIIDFNQGLDARELTEDKMKCLSHLPINPFRLAFDELKEQDVFKNALRLATKYGVKRFSTYILYNYEDRPEELYLRLEVNILLAKKLNVSIYSFPMLYAPVTQTCRKWIGRHWNHHYLKNIRSILNVTKGVVTKEADFFYKAFGEDLEGFHQILCMPRDYVVYRQYFENSGLKAEWYKEYLVLKNRNKLSLLIDILSGHKSASGDKDVESIMIFYQVSYKDIYKQYGEHKLNKGALESILEQ